MAADDFCVFFVGGGRLCRSTFHVGISSKLNRISSVRGTSMSENHDTKLCLHTRNVSLKLACRSKNQRHCWLSPTCRRHFQPSIKLHSMSYQNMADDDFASLLGDDDDGNVIVYTAVAAEVDDFSFVLSRMTGWPQILMVTR